MAQDFSNIPSPFDNLPEDHPVVFISYSWDSKEHREWVKKLSDDLREKHSVHTLLDQYNRGGYDLITFMTQAVEKADRVLMIGAPEYKKKSEKYDGGGVKYEDQLISIELYHRMGTSKFVPVLRAGKFDTSFSSLIEARTGYDMREDENYETVLNALAADLWNNPVNAAPNLHLLASTFLFHAIGVSCVKYGYYQILPVMMKRIVPAGHALSPSYPYPLAHLAGMNHWQADVLNIYTDANWLYPYSELISRNLKPCFEGCFLNDDEYRDCFAIWEHLFSLMYVYYDGAHLRNVEVFPIGLFLSERILRNNMMGGEDSYNRFFADANVQKNNWEPLKQRLFDGDYAAYKDVYDRGEAFYRQNRRY